MVNDDVKKERLEDAHNKGFTLIELIVVIVIMGTLVAIAVPAYQGYVEKITRQVCNISCQQLEKAFHIYLITENKEDSVPEYEFDNFLKGYGNSICPANGDIEYRNGRVKCVLHPRDTTNENDDGDDTVPFL
jgi:prepilin-type N-terminal cleavage/methylation domain-containing protein